MATGSLGLTTIRGALGATEGASTTPTRLLYIPVGSLDLSGIQQFETIEDRRAWAKADGLSGVYAGIENNQITLSNVPLSFQDAGFWFSTIPGIVSGSGTGAGTPTTTDTSAYIRTFTPSQTVTDVGATGGYDLHLQFGTTDLISTVGWSLPGLRCTSLTLTFNKRASGMDTGMLMSGTWVTPKTCTQITSFTGSLTDRTQTHIIGNNHKSYVDATYAGIGGSADANITSATWQWQRTPVFHDGMDALGLHTSMHFPGQPTNTLQITRKFSDTTELAAWIARTRRVVRIINEGAVVGAATAKNTLRFDFIGYPVAHVHAAQDDLLYATVDYEGAYDSTLLSSWSIYTINAVSAAYTTA